MEENNNITPEQLCAILQKQIDQLEQQMANMCGMKLYKKPEVFSQEDIYNLCGRNDDVATFIIRNGSESETLFGHEVTACFVYTQKERLKLEQDSSSQNDVPRIKAKALLPDYDQEKAQLLATNGINIHDIIEMVVAPSIPKENLFYGEEKRKPHVLKIPFEAEGKGKDIFWMYGALKRFIARGIALSPEEKSEYLAYKLIIEPEELKDKERALIFDGNGCICNNEVSLKYLIWKEEAGRLTDSDKKNLAELRYLQMIERLGKLDKALEGVGGLIKFTERFPDKAKLLVDKVLRFREHRYNVVGKHLLYMDLDSFIHIYLRHVEELKNNQIYGERTKFQLREEDVMIVIDHVLHDLNDDYQHFKDEHPDWEFRRYSNQAYYYNGDYYAIRIEPNGRLETFYKLGDRK